MAKNRDKKPTAFQLEALKKYGYTGKVATYRDAENAIRRIRRSMTNAMPVGESFETPDGKKYRCVGIEKGEPLCEECGKEKAKKSPQKKPCSCRKDACSCKEKKSAKSAPLAKKAIPGEGTFRIVLSDSAEGKALDALFVKHIEQMKSLMSQMSSVMEALLD